MKCVLVSLLLCAAVSAGRVSRDTTYTTKYDNVDIDEILKSDRLLTNYVNCLMDRGKCTPDGSELKRILPEALENDCEKCTEKQKTGSDKVIKFLKDNKAEILEELLGKYDPEGVYRKRYGN